MEPVLRESGYRTGRIGQSRPYRIAPLTTSGAGVAVRAFTFESVLAFTEDGAMTDAENAGCVTTYYEGMPLEDLMALHRLAEREVPKLLARRALPPAKWPRRVSAPRHVLPDAPGQQAADVTPHATPCDCTLTPGRRIVARPVRFRGCDQGR